MKVVDWVAIIISVISIILSIINFWRTIKPAQIRIYPSEDVVMATNGNDFIFHIPTVFVNLRNNAGVIKRYELEICNLEDTSEKRKVKWNSFCNYEGHNWTEGKKIFSIPVEEKSSVKECITFNAINNFDINKGRYKLTLTIYLFESKNKAHFKIDRYFDIGDSEALEIKDIKKAGSTEYYNRPIHLKDQNILKDNS